MIRDGEKWACAACIRGHRVSSCQHADRELHHINKKGRPVSQCQHCRGLRKSRAAHVKCDCGEHIQAHDSNGHMSDCKDDHGCPCLNGGKCNCALKKEAFDIDDAPKLSKAISHPKPTFPTRRSDAAIPKAGKNGHHHPPLHRANHAAHDFGVPYKIKNLHADDAALDYPTPSSYNPFFDAPSSDNTDQNPFEFKVPNSPHDTRLTRSAHASPILGPLPMTSIAEGQLPMSKDTDALTNGFPENFFNNGVPFSSPQRHSVHDFSTFSLDGLDLSQFSTNPQPMQSADAFQGVDWSHFQLNTSVDDNAMNANADLYPVPPSNASFDISTSSRPGLSHSSSGTASDAGETNSYADYTSMRNAVVDPSYDFPSVSETDELRLSTSYDTAFNPSQQFTYDLLSSPDLANLSGTGGPAGRGPIMASLSQQQQQQQQQQRKTLRLRDIDDDNDDDDDDNNNNSNNNKNNSTATDPFGADFGESTSLPGLAMPALSDDGDADADNDNDNVNWSQPDGDEPDWSGNERQGPGPDPLGFDVFNHQLPTAAAIANPVADASGPLSFQEQPLEPTWI